MSDAAEHRLDFTQYVALERASETKHEFCDGRMLAMAGGTPEHAELAANVIAELRPLARGRGCRVFTADLLIRVSATGLATYPDAAVVCGPLRGDPEDARVVTNPSVLVEVLSPRTEGYDRGEKFAHYQQIDSLTDYVLVSQHEVRIEHYRRELDGEWRYRALGPGARLPVLGSEIPIEEIYAGVELVPRPPRQGFEGPAGSRNG